MMNTPESIHAKLGESQLNGRLYIESKYLLNGSVGKDSNKVI